MSISYNLEELNKLTNEELSNVFTEETKPTLKNVLSKLKRKVKKVKKEEK